MKLVVDMNLAPAWVTLLTKHGYEAIHWSSVGAFNAPDTVIMKWARDHSAVVFTHDLDFGILLAVTRAGSPSVIQVRTQDVSPQHLGDIIINVLRNHAVTLVAGALITVDEAKSRVRILPIC